MRIHNGAGFTECIGGRIKNGREGVLTSVYDEQQSVLCVVGEGQIFFDIGMEAAADDAHVTR